MFDNIPTPKLLKHQTALRIRQINAGNDGLPARKALALLAATQELDRRCAAGDKHLR